jgi:hypothetical protein
MGVEKQRILEVAGVLQQMYLGLWIDEGLRIDEGLWIGEEQVPLVQ